MRPSRPMPRGDILDIGADRLAQIGHLVDEGDLGREKRVGRVFDQLGGLERGEDHRGFQEVERPIQRSQNRPRVLALGADDHPVGPHEICDRRSLAQEFRVRGDIEAALRQRVLEDALDLAPSADGHCRLGHHDRAFAGSPRQRRGDLAGGGEDVSEIGVTVAAPRRRPDRNEYRVGPIDRGVQIGREAEPPRGGVAGDQLVEAGLEDRDLAALEAFDLAGILVDAGDRYAEFGKARARDQADISRPDHRDAH